jgi:hypothetical protein
MQYCSGGVGPLGTRHCDKVLLADKHAPPDASDIVEPSTKPDGDRDSDDEAEGWQGEDEDEGNDENRGEDNNDEQVVAASHDLDIVTAAGFGVL